MLNRIRGAAGGLPGVFWTLTGAMFIDRLGGALVFPFLSLYVANRYNVGMTQVGTLFAIFAISSLVGSILGGALTDKFGRKVMLLLGLVLSASSAVLMGLMPSIQYFYILAAFVGLLAEMGGPAQQAMVADLLPEQQRARGYGVLRVGANLAVTLGPMIGGLLAGVSYLLLFILDAVMSLITAGIVLAAIPETHPGRHPDRQADVPHESLAKTLSGYRLVGRDRLFIAFLLAATAATLVYVQMNSTLAVYLNRFQGISPQGFGYILSMNAAMVVAFQFWITGRIQDKQPMIVLAAGTILYAVGFGLYGLVSRYSLFLVAMVIITIGEMLVVPVWQAVVARFAPASMRGRYMAVAGMSWTIPAALGPLIAGLVIDNIDPEWLWYGCFVLGLAAAAGYLRLHLTARQRLGGEATLMENA